MKKLNLLAGLAFVVLLFTHCKEQTAEAGNQAAQTVNLPPNLSGYWVNEAWWKELLSTRSPKKAAEKSGDIAAAIIHQDSSKWLADLSLAWHEGQQLTLRVFDGGLQLYDPTNAAVTALPVVPKPDSSLQIGTVTMVRLGESFTGANAIAHTVMGGQYTLGGKTVVFNPNGTVVGLDNYYRYELLLDYVTDEVGADQLLLSREGEGPEFYAFKFEDKKLLLYNLDDVGGKDDFQYKVGKLRYELTK